MNKRYYWLKFSKDFFKDHKIKILESLPNGEKYLLFYIKLMAESVSHEGRLRFNDAIPYSDQMLAAVLDTDVDVVRSAIQALQDLQLLEIMDDKTLYMTQVRAIIGSETPDAERMRRARLAKKDDGEQCSNNVRECSNIVTERLEIRDKSTLSKIPLDNISSIPSAGAREEDGEKTGKTEPSRTEVVQFFIDQKLIVNPLDFIRYYDVKGWPEDWKSSALTWDNYFKQSPQGKRERTRALELELMNAWEESEANKQQ